MPTQLSEAKSFMLSDLNGQFVACFRHDSQTQPRMIAIEGQPFVPIFANEDALQEVMQHLGITNYIVNHIDDGAEFVESVMARGAKACFNVYCIEGKKLRYTEIRMEGPE